MIPPETCQGCRYYAFNNSIGFYCDYAFMRGHTRLAQTTREELRAGRCPVTEPGIRETVVMRPRVHPYDEPRMATGNRYHYDRTLFRKLWAAGHTDQEIAEQAGCSVTVVFRWRKLLGLDYNKPKGDAV